MRSSSLSSLLVALVLSIGSTMGTGVTRTVSLDATAQPTTPPSLPKRQLPTLGGGAGASNPSSAAPISTAPANAAAGGLYYIEPAVTAAASYYKIMASNPITFAWNFTSLYVQPKSLTFQAYCAANSKTYPVGPTAGVPGTATSVVWDPYAYEQSPGAPVFAQASYTLRVFDERGPTALASPGYFSGQNAVVVFAMYSPAAYTPLASGWTCAACTSYAPSITKALSHPAVVALPLLVSMFLIGGASVLYR